MLARCYMSVAARCVNQHPILSGSLRTSAFTGTPAYALQIAPKKQVAGRTYRCTPVLMGRRSAKIATRKTAQDAQKAKQYGKIGKLIIKAVKAGGPDPNSNGTLKEVLAQAKDAQVPKDIVQRNIKRAAETSQADFTEVLYEAYGPGGTGFVIECLTDNLNRSASEVRSAVSKGGGKMADPGSVLFNFQRRGVVLVKGDGADEDTLLGVAMDVGADDVQAIEDEEVPTFKVSSSVEAFAKLNNAVKDLGLTIDSEVSGLVYEPLMEVEVADDNLHKNDDMLSRLLEVDDVDMVYNNCAGLA